jgi:uridine phosphorylase
MKRSESMIKEPHFTPQKMLALLGLKTDSLGPYALIPGPKERSQMLLGTLENPKKNFTFLDYEMYTGMMDGKRVTVGNGGRYAPDTAMTTEILCAAGAESLIRIGSCGSLQEQVKIGDLVIVTGAIRGEGTTSYYVPKNFSTVAHPDIVSALKEAAESVGVRYHLGWIFTTDALFQETPELIQELNEQNVSSIDMVTSTFLTIAQLRTKKAGAILAVSDECLHAKFAFRDPVFLAAEEKMVEVAQQALRYL